MLLIVVLFSLLSGFLNALAAVLQRRATGQVGANELFRGRILSAALQNKWWLSGIGLQIAGFLAVAAALRSGSLVIVEPLITSDLIFLMALIHFGLKVPVGRREWAAVLLLSGGLSGLVAVTNPHGGIAFVHFRHWLVAFVVIGGLIVLGGGSSRRIHNVHVRAAVAGIAAGLHFSMTAVCAKLVLQQLQFGALHEFSSWPLYTLLVVGISSALTMQSMYGAGPLAITQPALELTEAITGAVIGLALFSDTIRHSPPAIALEVICGLIITGGIILLAGSQRLLKPELIKRQ